ncbi:MAG: YlbF family regulator [Bacilli bacterium]|nr:YlbF family regulator [Bacilli bacterium]
MKSVDEALLDVKEELFSLPLIQEYLHVKSQIENDEYLVKLDKEVREHQKKMCENVQNDEVYLKEKTLFETKDNKLKDNPLYQNYLSLKEEVVALLEQIKDSLQ